MELVNVKLYTYARVEYEDNIWIKKSSYEKLKDAFPKEIVCEELDGKYSEVIGDVKIQDYWKTDDDYAKAGIKECDGYILKNALIDLYGENNLDWDTEQEEIRKCFDGFDCWKDIIVRIPKSKKKELMDFVNKLVWGN